MTPFTAIHHFDGNSALTIYTNTATSALTMKVLSARYSCSSWGRSNSRPATANTTTMSPNRRNTVRDLKTVFRNCDADPSTYTQAHTHTQAH